jgi:hypothetical protein
MYLEIYQKDTASFLSLICLEVLWPSSLGDWLLLIIYLQRFLLAAPPSWTAPHPLTMAAPTTIHLCLFLMPFEFNIGNQILNFLRVSNECLCSFQSV